MKTINYLKSVHYCPVLLLFYDHRDPILLGKGGDAVEDSPDRLNQVVTFIIRRRSYGTNLVKKLRAGSSSQYRIP